mgnify:CR=1 FL=1
MVWRHAVQQVKQNGAEPGQVILLWPAPDSLYARFWTPTGMTAGIAYCPLCCPEIGDLPPPMTSGGEPIEAGGCIEHLTAHAAYGWWFEPAREVFYRAHLRDQIGYGEDEIEALMTQWQSDRRGA